MSRRTSQVITAHRTMPGIRCERIYDYLSVLENHWVLSRVFRVKLIDGDGDGALVEVSGPLGIRRTVQTRIESRTPFSALRGIARHGDTVAAVTWLFQHSEREGCEVHIEIEVVESTPIDRILIAVSKRWLSTELRLILRELEARLRL